MQNRFFFPRTINSAVLESGAGDAALAQIGLPDPLHAGPTGLEDPALARLAENIKPLAHHARRRLALEIVQVFLPELVALLGVVAGEHALGGEQEDEFLGGQGAAYIGRVVFALPEHVAGGDVAAAVGADGQERRGIVGRREARCFPRPPARAPRRPENP